MALTTTIGGTSSDSYGSLAEADAYFAARETGSWDGSDSHKEMALRKAATYLDNVYRGRWKGVKVSRDQSLAWPRANVLDVDGYSIEVTVIPQQVKNAQFEAAKIIAGGTELEGTIDRAVKSEKVGDISVTYSDGAALAAQYPQVSNWLSDLVNGSAGTNGSFGTSSIVRA